MDLKEKMEGLGIVLPPAPVSGGNYSVCRRSGSMIFTSGQTPRRNGALLATGRVGREVGEDRAYELVREATLNALSAIDAFVGLDSIAQFVRATVYISSAEDFFAQPKVANGCTDLLVQLFGDYDGKPARSAVGVYALPGNAPCEVELTAELKSTRYTR